jgi:hypothetical protein
MLRTTKARRKGGRKNGTFKSLGKRWQRSGTVFQVECRLHSGPVLAGQALGLRKPFPPV